MRLTGVGVGPGDPELVTVKGVRALREAAVVVVPVMSLEEEGRAERTVRAHLAGRADGEVVRLVFALDDRTGASAARTAAWDAAGAEVARLLRERRDVAFATIGDPAVYSTFSYLATTVRDLLPEVEVVTVPGITAMQDLAARSGTVLCEGTETLALLPLTAGLDALDEALTRYDSVVAYKGGRHLERVRALLDRHGRLDDAVYGAALGLPGQVVGPLPEGEAPYLSTVLVPPRRTGRGARLAGLP